MQFFSPPTNAADLPVTELEKSALPRGKQFSETGNAYAKEHGTRPATIGFALSSSPLALLSWIGEKFLEWTDEDPTMDQILDSVTLYWLTDTYSRCIYPYKTVSPLRFHPSSFPPLSKPPISNLSLTFPHRALANKSRPRTASPPAPKSTPKNPRATRFSPKKSDPSLCLGSRNPGTWCITRATSGEDILRRWRNPQSSGAMSRRLSGWLGSESLMIPLLFLSMKYVWGKRKRVS